MLDTLLDIKEKEITSKELTKKDLDNVRNIDGFPIGKDEDIIELSNPPYYTAFPNPFIKKFIEEYGKEYDEETDTYKREPFTADVSEGKNDPIYNAHSYHTKVPYKAIMKYILHYTNPGDIVFDGFCGTGMTGVATQMCGTENVSLKREIESDVGKVEWGFRNAIVSDISPLASFISYNYNTKIDINKFEEYANNIINNCEKEFGWMNETIHMISDNCSIKGLYGKINYIVWSDIYICDNCNEEFIYWDAVVNKNTGEEYSEILCPKCHAKINIRELNKVYTMYFDKTLNEVVKIPRQEAVMIKYTYKGKQYKKIPDEYDKENIKKIEDMEIKYWYPINKIPNGDKTGEPIRIGINRVYQIYTKRNLIFLSYIYNSIDKIGDKRIRNHLKYLFNSIYTRSHKMNRYIPKHNRHVGPLNGTLYFSYFQAEINILNLLREKLETIKKANFDKKNIMISTQSMTDLSNIKDNSIDYVFIDPPFGDNLMYSELNFSLESWNKVFTNNINEAIINKSQRKDIFAYKSLMEKSFSELFRVIKPNRWITVEFHNSKNIVWNVIQETLLKAGFIVADVRILDKKKGTVNQLSSNGAVKKDLVISAYKPKKSVVERILNSDDSIESLWDFIREHLKNLPVVNKESGKIKIIKEREKYLLFDRMIAFYIVNGLAIPLSAMEFYKGLDDRFIKRDGMYFLSDQINEYDNMRILSDIENIQFDIFVTTEKEAISWLYKELDSPKTYSEIMPKFMQEIRIIKHEKMPELKELLEENFLKDDEGKWYIPDITKSGDLIKLREKRLIKEFEEYLKGKGKLKVFRTEAVRAGFAKLWKEKDYKNIVKLAERLPESVIQEDDKLLMYYDISLSRIE
ncbi:DNA methyltransferase [Clostridium celatum]|uniref:DNA methyltransferase n=1 Tax=Clostridium celatum TaxID=36834 RepID=UPI001897B616|nr:DNA methyltransferase [Clostridium celatum]